MPHLREIIDTATSGDHESIVIKGSAQWGKSEVILNLIGYHMHHDPAPILYCNATLDLVKAFSKDRLMPMIRDTPVLADLVGTPRSKDSDNTVLHKRFRGGRITLVGANASAGFRMRAVRIVIFDDIDGFPPSTAEGDQISLGIKRSTTYLDRLIIYSGTPTIESTSRIDEAFSRSDQRHYNVPCPLCGTFQKLEWEYVQWPAGRPELANYICSKCSRSWKETQHMESLSLGQWRPENPSSSIPGFFANDILNPFVKLSSMAADFLVADYHSNHGNNEKLRTWINLSLGKSWKIKGEKLDDAPFLTRRENYTTSALPWRILYLTAGVDIQADRVEAEIFGWRSERQDDPPECWSIEAPVLHGDVTQGDVLKELDGLLLREYLTEDGRRLRVSAACIDAGYKTQEIMNFCSRRVGRHVHAVKGADGARPIWPPRMSKSKKYPGMFLYIVGSDSAKDNIYSRLQVQEAGPGYCHFNMSCDESYFRQVVSEEKRSKIVRGKEIKYWYLREGRRNEGLDRHVYGLAALYSHRVPWEMLARSAPSEPPPQPEGGDGGVPPPPPPRPEPPRQQGRKVRFRFGR